MNEQLLVIFNFFVHLVFMFVEKHDIIFLT